MPESNPSLVIFFVLVIFSVFLILWGVFWGQQCKENASLSPEERGRYAGNSTGEWIEN